MATFAMNWEHCELFPFKVFDQMLSHRQLIKCNFARLLHSLAESCCVDVGEILHVDFQKIKFSVGLFGIQQTSYMRSTRHHKQKPVSFSLQFC